MKKLLLFFVGIVVSANIFGQNESELNCYEEYSTLFDERGAASAHDGEYKEVYITVRKGMENADCFIGSALVKNNRITDLYITFVDGTKEPFEKKYKQVDAEWSIFRGVSKSRITTDNEIVNVFFVSLLKEKKKEYMRAPKSIK